MKELFNLFRTSLKYALCIVLILWIIKCIESLLGLNFYTFGIYPRSTDGLWGILTSPLIHGNFQHLIANTIPMLVLTTLLFLFYRKKAVFIFILLWITAGILTWIIGRPSWHIGISSVIYALASFLIFGGFFSKNFKLIIVSIIVIIAYSGLIFGVFPGEERVSWEGHLSGALGGLLWAYVFRKEYNEAKR